METKSENVRVKQNFHWKSGNAIKFQCISYAIKKNVPILTFLGNDLYSVCDFISLSSVINFQRSDDQNFISKYFIVLKPKVWGNGMGHI